MPTWEVVYGRCGSCIQFRKDFGGSTGKVYGHCSVKPRSGSISSADAKCDVYEPIAEVAPERRHEPPPPPKPARPPVDPFDVTRSTLEEDMREPARRPVRPAPVLVRRPSRDDDDVPAAAEGGAPLDKSMLRRLIREAIEDSLGIGEVETLDRFKDGTIDINPGIDGAASKTLPIESLMHKIVMIRDNLRMLEQKINSNPKLDDAEKVVLQQYVTRCYGSLTTFNMLFKNRDDWFKGAGD